MAEPKGTRPPAAGKGRPKGARNKLTRNVKEMILGALSDVGGQNWLVKQATLNPMAFMRLRIKRPPRARGNAPVVRSNGTTPHPHTRARARSNLAAIPAQCVRFALSWG
jgi:hypothetical protein